MKLDFSQLINYQISDFYARTSSVVPYLKPAILP